MLRLIERARRQPSYLARARAPGLVHFWGVPTPAGGPGGLVVDCAGSAPGSFGIGSPTTTTGNYWTHTPYGRGILRDDTGTGTVASGLVLVGDAAGTGSPRSDKFTLMLLASFADVSGVRYIYGGVPNAIGYRLNGGVVDLIKVDVAAIGASSTTLTAGVWYHIAVAYDGATARYYLNGRADGTGSSTQTFDHAQQYAMFARRDGGVTNSQGNGTKFAAISVWNRPLSQSEIWARYINTWHDFIQSDRRLQISSGAAGGAIDGVAELQEANDSLASAVSLAVDANAALQEANDTLVSISAVAVTGTASIQEAADTLASDGTVAFPGVIGTAALLEANDVLISSVSAVITGTAAIAEASDVLTSAAAVSITASASLLEANDTLAAEGGSASFAIAAMTERDDALTATGTVLVTGTASISEASDVLASAATVSITATAALQEANDLLTAAGSVGTVIRTADAALQEANDTLAATAVSSISASAAIIEAGDIVVSGVTVLVTANAALVEENDGLTSSGTAMFGVFADAALQEANDTLTSAVVQKIARRIAASDALRGGIAASDAGRWTITSSDGLN